MTCAVSSCPDDATLEVAHLNGVTERYCGRHGGMFRWPRKRFKRVQDHWERWQEQDEVSVLCHAAGVPTP